MNKLFIDTNAFERIGLNFDENNPIIYLLIKNVNDKMYEYYSLSVIDNEVISHIKEKCLDDYNKLNKYKWLRNYISEDVIKNNSYKYLTDYNQFKEKISAIECDISNINPEDIFDKYFKIEYPFEKGDKRKEFPDAFISSYVNNVKCSDTEKIYFVSNDNTLKRSLNNNIVIFDDLKSFLSVINKITPEKYKKIESFILENISMIQDDIFKKMDLTYHGLEGEEIEIDSLSINNIIDIKVLGHPENDYFVVCKCDYLILKGLFSCLDYDNSYAPNDSDFYTILQYISTKEVHLNGYEFIIELYDDNDEFMFVSSDKYRVDLTYETIRNADCERHSPYDDYDGEDSWAQDGGYR